MTGSFAAPPRARRLAIAAVGLALLTASSSGSAASPAPSAGPDACFEYGREIRDLSWDVSGRHLAVLSWYHRDSRVDVIEWPSMTIRQVDSSPYAYIDHGTSVAVDADGTVWWSGLDAAGPRITMARPGSEPETRWRSEPSDPLWAVQQLYRTPDGLEFSVAAEHTEYPYSRHVRIEDTDPAIARFDDAVWVDHLYVTPDGRSRLLADNTRLPDVEVRNEEASSTASVVGDAWDLSLSPDGGHILWHGYDHVMTRPVEGGEVVEIADVGRTASAGPHGVIAYPAQSQRFADLWDWDDGTRFDPPLLPDRLCFTRAPWAPSETPLPPMPSGETIAIQEPARPLPEAVRSLSALLPNTVDDRDVSWSEDVLESPRDSASYDFRRRTWPPALQFAVRELGVDPFDMYFGLGSDWSDDIDDDPLDVTVFADPDGDGRRWVDPLVKALLTYGRSTRVATSSETTLAGRDVIRIEANDPGDEFGHQTDYVLTSGPYVFLINTNQVTLAEAMAAALP